MVASFGNFMKMEREKRKWTQTEFGSRIGLNSSAISRIENGSQLFSKSKLKLLSITLELELQIVTDLYFAEKFAKEAIKYNCSEAIFVAARDTADHIKSSVGQSIENL